MSHSRNLSEVDFRPNSAYRTKGRNSIEPKKQVTQSNLKKESPYKKVPSITKTRSITSIKMKPSFKHRSNSPNVSKVISSNSSMANINAFELPSNQSQRSITESYRQLYKEYPSKKNFSYKSGQDLKGNQSSNELIHYEERIKNLEKIDVEISIHEYFKIFSEVIEKDQVYGKVLKKIKIAFEELLKTKEKNIQNAEVLKKNLADSLKKISVMVEDRKFIDRRIQQISQENLDLCKSLEECEASYSEIEEKLVKITNFSIENVSQDEQTWKALVIENKSYADICKKMKEDLKNYRKKEKKLLKLIIAMKNRGYPVEEIYNKEIFGLSEENDENSESDRIVSGRAPEVNKPEKVPPLKIEKIEPETFSSSSFSSSLHQTE